MPRRTHCAIAEEAILEGIAKQLHRYTAIQIECADILRKDPVRRDKCMAECLQLPNVHKDLNISGLVPQGEDPDIYLKQVDKQLAIKPRDFK